MASPEKCRGAFMANEGREIYSTWLDKELESPDLLFADFEQRYIDTFAYNPPRTVTDRLYAVAETLMATLTQRAYEDTVDNTLNAHDKEIRQYTSVANVTGTPTGHALDGLSFAIGFPLGVAYDAVSDALPDAPAPEILEETAYAMSDPTFLDAMNACGTTAFGAWMGAASAIDESGREHRAKVVGLQAANGRAPAIAIYDPYTKKTSLKEGVEATLLLYLKQQNRNGADVGILGSDVVKLFRRQVSRGCPVASPVKSATQSGIEHSTLFVSWVLGKNLNIAEWPARFGNAS